MEYSMQFFFFMAVAMIVMILTVTRSESFRRYALIQDNDVKFFCWIIMVPFLGEIILGVSVLTSLVNFINKNVFVVK